MDDNKINKCKNDTYEHIRDVGRNINILVKELINRAERHDSSKFDREELDVFAQADLLGEIEYGSPEYRENMERIKPAIQHHYKLNSHHPEFFKDGINDMDLIDILEMLADWKSATLRNKGGNIRKSIEINANKFNISSQLQRIMENTVKKYF